MKLIKYIGVVFIFCINNTIAQVGIGTTTPNANLDIRSSNQATPANNDGMLIPKADEFPLTPPTAAQDGMMLYLTGIGAPSKGFYYWDQTQMAWLSATGAKRIDELIDGKSDNDGNSVFLGIGAGVNDDGTNNLNTGLGFQALGSNTIGHWNTAVGYQSLSLNTTGRYNSAFGHLSLRGNTTGDFNVALGSIALINNSTGNENTAVGRNALSQNIVGNGNTAIGRLSLRNVLGSYNVGVGYYAGEYETGSNKLYIENSNANQENALIYGDFGTDNTTVGNILRTNSEFQIGNPTNTGYAFPTIDGIINQVLQTDGSGQVNWVNNSGIGTDDQNLTGTTLTGTTLQIDIENGSSTSVDLAGLQDGIGTDNQNLSAATLTGTNLQIDIENGSSASVDLSSFADADNLGNHTATTTLSMATNNITSVNYLSTRPIFSYDKLRVWNTANFGIGLQNNMTYGFLNNAAMTFTMSTETNRGWVWRDTADAQNDGAMSLTTDGRMTLKNHLRVDTNTLTVDATNNRVGIRTITPNATLDMRSSNQATPANTDGLLIPKIDEFPTAPPTAAQAGMLVYATGNGSIIKGFYYWDYVVWVPLISYSTVSFGTATNVTSNSPGDYATDDFVFGSPQLDDDGDINHDRRMFFSKSKGAFRAGQTMESQWDDLNVGLNSTAFGTRNRATAYNSVAFGNQTRATGLTSTAFGLLTHAFGVNSIVMGNSTYASGESSLAMGYFSVARGYASSALGYHTDADAFAVTAIGRYNNGGGNSTTWVNTDPLLEVGNGTSNVSRNNALTILKNGNMIVDGDIVIEGDATDRELRIEDDAGNNDRVLMRQTATQDIYVGDIDNNGGDTYVRAGGSTELSVIAGTGFVGVNTNAPAYTFEVNGNAAKPGGGSWINSSDKRLKKNIKKYTSGLEHILKIEPVSYQYNHLSGFDKSKTYVGVIAQDLQKVDSTMVLSYSRDNNEYLAVDNSAMTYMLINATKTQQKEIEDLKL